MSELHDLRRKMVKYYDDLVVMMGEDPTSNTEAFIRGIRACIEMTTQFINEEEKRIADQFDYGKLSEL